MNRSGTVLAFSLAGIMILAACAVPVSIQGGADHRSSESSEHPEATDSSTSPKTPSPSSSPQSSTPETPVPSGTGQWPAKSSTELSHIVESLKAPDGVSLTVYSKKTTDNYLNKGFPAPKPGSCSGITYLRLLSDPARLDGTLTFVLGGSPAEAETQVVVNLISGPEELLKNGTPDVDRIRACPSGTGTFRGKDVVQTTTMTTAKSAAGTDSLLREIRAAKGLYKAQGISWYVGNGVLIYVNVDFESEVVPPVGSPAPVVEQSNRILAQIIEQLRG